ncbi:tetratricopeptide repeat protein [Polaromonas sp.]|uniref:tetratricopeptide repeat protein n=1 Tax=Polaromonas sp. TaxID=1869339 RepID=UPI0035680E66
MRVRASRLQQALAVCLALGSLPLQAQTTAPVAPAATGAAPAAATCPAQPAYPLPAGALALQALLAQINAMASDCLKNPPYHAWRGAVLLALRQPAAATEALERALLLDPEQPGALLDYADALLAVGDTASARGLLLQISARTDLPANLRPLLERELALTSLHPGHPGDGLAPDPHRDPDAWRSRWMLSTALGRDSNLNNGPAASELTLTFPQGALTLPLLASARPQSGHAVLTTAQWQALKPQGTQLWLLQAEVRNRHTASHATRYQQADLAASWLQAPEAPRQWVVRSGLSQVDFGGQRLLNNARLSALHQWQASQWAAAASLGPLARCRPGTGAELELRRYPASPELNGRYSGLLAAVNCGSLDAAGSQAGLGNPLIGLQLRLGQDQPDSATRPGGSYRRAELRATWEARLGRYKANADYSYTRQHDATGYSPLLSSNLARRASRHNLRAELAHPLPTSWLAGAEGFVTLEHSRQRSNLAVFESRQTALYAGLRWSPP